MRTAKSSTILSCCANPFSSWVNWWDSHSTNVTWTVNMQSVAMIQHHHSMDKAKTVCVQEDYKEFSDNASHWLQKRTEIKYLSARYSSKIRKYVCNVLSSSDGDDKTVTKRWSKKTGDISPWDSCSTRTSNSIVREGMDIGDSRGRCDTLRQLVIGKTSVSRM